MKKLKRGLFAMCLVLLAAGGVTGGYLANRQIRTALEGASPEKTVRLEEEGVRYGDRMIYWPEEVKAAMDIVYPLLPARSRIAGQIAGMMKNRGTANREG